MIYLNRIRIPIERVLALKLHDRYDMHKIVCNLFPQGTEHSFYVHPVVDMNGKVLVIDAIANEPANGHDVGIVETKKLSDSFLNHKKFKFSVELNPTNKVDGKRKSLFGQGEKLTEDEKEERLFKWALKHFENKRSGRVIISNVDGIITVNDTELFKKALVKGIGPVTFLGIGMLRLLPV